MDRLTIEKTSNYGMFINVKENRDIKPNHVKRLIQSFEANYLISPLIVNEKLEIIDGQHRFEAAKSLRLPVYYFIVTGYGNRQMQILNETNVKWSKADYLEHWCKLEVESYVEFKELWGKFPEFQFSGTMAICGVNEAARSKGDVFKRGEMVIADIDKAYDYAAKIRALKPYCEFYNVYRFVRSFISLMDNKNFDYGVFMHKLEAQPTVIKMCATDAQYQELFENIFNYRNRNKVNLRF